MIVNGIEVAVERKSIKNLHLAVYPPDARVHVSSPDYLADNDIRSFLLTKWDWVEQQREEILNQPRQTQRQYVTGESYYLLGVRYRLRVIEKQRVAHSVCKQGVWLVMTIQPETSVNHRAELLREFYRSELKKLLEDIVPRLQVSIGEADVTWEVKQMKTQWGSCVAKKRHLILNLELSRVPQECIEYVVMHELCHLRVANHNKMFEALMSQRMPKWRSLRQQLNDFIALPMNDAQNNSHTRQSQRMTIEQQQ